MGEVERGLNEYLFHEFGVEGEELMVSETWPFNLRPVGVVAGRIVFEFDEQEPFFAIAEPADFFPKGGMGADDLALQFLGAGWIAKQEPVTLAESRLFDQTVPSGIERRRALQELGAQTVGVSSAEILEGLFLRRRGHYLGLFRAPAAREAVVGGLGVSATVGYPDCSPWRRLAWAVGQWIKLQHHVAEDSDAANRG